MQKVFYLKTCSTCNRILNSLNIPDHFILQNIKEKNIDAKTLDLIVKQSGSYESLFSKRAMKYRAMGLHEKELQDKDYRELILQEYTFLKRPIFIDNNNLFVGNSKSTKGALSKHFNHR